MKSNFIKIIIFYFIVLILIILPLLLPVGFSPDSKIYFYTINYSKEQFNFNDYEPIYWFIIYLNKMIFNSNYKTFLLFFSFVFVSVYLKLIKKYSKSFIVSFFIFLFLFYPTFGLIQIRNGLATAFLLWSIFDLINDKKDKFILKIIFATLCHYSSIIFIILIFLKNDKINKIFYIIIPFIGIIVGKYILTINFLDYINKYFPLNINKKVQPYIDLIKYYGYDGRSLNEKLNLINLFSLFNIIIYYFSLIIKINDKNYIILVKIQAIGLFLYFSLSTIAVFSLRFSYNFFIFIIFLIPYTIKSIKLNKYGIIILYHLIFFILLIMFFNNYIRHPVFNFNVLFYG